MAGKRLRSAVAWLGVAAVVIAAPLVYFSAMAEASAFVDTTFGSGGSFVFGGGNSVADVVVVQLDGKSLITGFFGNLNQGGTDFGTIRLNTNGTLDPSFGSGGLARTPVGGGVDGGTGLAVQPDAKIVVVGVGGASGNNMMVVVRYDPAGHLDPSFGSGGVVSGKPGGAYAAASVALQADGKILVGVSGATVVRLNTNGSLDTSWGNGGVASVSYNGSPLGPLAVIAQPDGSTLVLGSEAVARLSAGGRLDTSYGSGGFATITRPELGNTSAAFGRLGDGRLIVVGGTSSGGGQTVFSRFTTGGQADPSFGTNGVMAVADGHGGVTAATVLPDGSVVATASTTGGPIVSSYTPKAMPDPTFGPNGTASVTFPKSSSSQLRAVAIQPDGKVLVAGDICDCSSATSPGVQYAVARLDRTATGSGYWMVDAAGRVYAFGQAGFAGGASLPPGVLAVHIEPTPDGNGYWIVDSQGHVYAIGDAGLFGGNPSLRPGEVVSSLSSTTDGRGYWIFTNLGRVITYGDATFYGDMSHTPLNGPVLDSARTVSGNGYFMVGSDGGIFTFGDARFYGSMGATHLNAPVVGLAPNPNGSGYWLVAGDGGTFSFNSPFRGSMGAIRLNRPIIGMVAYGNGYLMVASDGGIFDFSDKPFTGSLGNSPPASPIVGVAPL